MTQAKVVLETGPSFLRHCAREAIVPMAMMDFLFFLDKVQDFHCCFIVFCVNFEFE